MILCLSGYKGSGKDASADYLLKNHGAVRTALADPLKGMVVEEFDIPIESLYDPNLKEKPILTMPVEPKDAFTKMICEFMFKEFRDEMGVQPHKFTYSSGNFKGYYSDGGTVDLRTLYHTPRSLAILKGSTNRVVNPNYWTDKAFDRISLELKRDPNRIVVVTDVRYKSEMAKFKEKFGDEVVFIRINRTQTTSNDPSERDLDDAEFDFHVDNVSSYEYLYSQLKTILQYLKLA